VSESALALNKPAGAVAIALEAAGFLEAVNEGKCNLVTPAVFLDKPPALHRLGVRAITLDVDRETYKSPNGKEGEVALGAVALQRIAKNAQVSWEDPKRLDDGKEPYLRSYSVGGTVLELDGTRTRLLPGVVTLDFRGEPSWPEEKLGADARRCLQNAEKKTSKPWPIPNGESSKPCRDCGQPVFWIETPAKRKLPVNADGFCHFDTCTAKAANRAPDGWAEIFQARQFIDRLCVTKAMSACIRKLGIPSSLPRERAAKPWVVMTLVQDLDMNDPVQKQAALAQCLGASAAMYGAPGPVMARAPAVINVAPEPADEGPECVVEPEVVEPEHVPAVVSTEPWDAPADDPPPPPARYMLTIAELQALPPAARAWGTRINELAQAVYDRFGTEVGQDHLAATYPDGWDPATAPVTLGPTEVSKLGAALKALLAGR
jgi:hypothetical protein